MFILITLALIAIPVNALQRDKWMYGFPCKSTSNCNSNSYRHFIAVGEEELECDNGRCRCKDNIMVKLNYNRGEARFECQHSLFSMFGPSYKCDGPGDANCTANSQCKTKSQYQKNYKCVCDDEHFRIGDECRGVEHVRVGEKCFTPKTGPLKYCDLNFNMSCQNNTCQCIRDYYGDNGGSECISREEYIDKFRANLTVNMYESCKNQSDGLPKLCDEAANMNCRDYKCQCKPNFYYNTYNSGNETDSGIETISSCETKEFYVAKYNLTSYKVMVGMYCHSKYDCIDGLTCHDYKCSCPYPCQYEAKSISCDCGEVSPYEGTGRPILVGIIGGIVIIAGWVHLIKKQMRKAKGPEYTTTSTDGDSNRNNTNSTRYPLQPTTTDVPITGGLALQPTTNRSTEPYRIQTTTGQPGASSSSPARPQKSPLPSYPSTNSDIPPTYESLYTNLLELSNRHNPHPRASSMAFASLPHSLAPSYPTAPPTGFTAAPVPYPGAPSYPTAPPTDPASAPLTYPPTASAPLPYSTAPSNPAASADSTSDVPRDAPPPQIDIYQPIIS